MVSSAPILRDGGAAGGGAGTAFPTALTSAAGTLALVASGWSRVYVFGILGVLLYLQSGIGALTGWLSEILNGLGSTLLNAGLTPLANVAFSLGDWLSGTGANFLERIAGALFWPLNAIAEAVINGYFTPFQALAPALLLLYATILFMLAAEFFTTKDLFLTE